MKTALLNQNVVFMPTIGEVVGDINEHIKIANKGTQVSILQRAESCAVMILHQGLTKWVHEDVLNQSTSLPEHAGMDYFGNEILVGDEIVVDEVKGETILKADLEKYLAEQHYFTFKTAE